MLFVGIIGTIIGLSFLLENFNQNYKTIFLSITSSGGVVAVINLFLLLLKKMKNNPSQIREININETLADQTTNDILNITINNALIERKIFFLKWPIKLWKYCRLSYEDENIILHFENIDRLWDWLKIDTKNESNNEMIPRAKIIIEILENIGLLYKNEKNNIKILIEFDPEINDLILKYNKNRKLDHNKKIINNQIEIKSLNTNSLLKLEEEWNNHKKWNNEEKIIIKKIGDNLYKYYINSWNLKDDIIKKIKSFSKRFKRFIEIDKLEKINDLNSAFSKYFKNEHSEKNEIYLLEYDWEEKIEHKELFNSNLLEVIYLLNNPFNKIKVNQENLNSFIKKYINYIKEYTGEFTGEYTREYTREGKIKNNLYLKMLKTFNKKIEKMINNKNDSKIILNKQFFNLIINHFNTYEIYNFFLSLNIKKVQNELIKYFLKYINKENSLFNKENKNWISKNKKSIFIIVISMFLELLNKKNKKDFWQNGDFIIEIIDIFHEEEEKDWNNDWKKERLNILIERIWNKLSKNSNEQIFLLKKYKYFINSKNILEKFLKDFPFIQWKENEESIIQIINNLTNNKTIKTIKQIKELFFKHKEKNVTKKELNQWIKKKKYYFNK